MNDIRVTTNINALVDVQHNRRSTWMSKNTRCQLAKRCVQVACDKITMKILLVLFAPTTIFISLFPSVVFAGECYKSSIINPTPFMGNNEEIFKLSDGSVWEVKYEYEYLYEYYPSVIICPSRGKLIIDNKSLNVEPIFLTNSGTVKSTGQWEIYEETNLQGSISGTIRRGHIFKTTSGSIYEVTGLTLQLVLELQPSVIVLRNGSAYKLVVEGFDEPLICAKLK